MGRKVTDTCDRCRKQQSTIHDGPRCPVGVMKHWVTDENTKHSYLVCDECNEILENREQDALNAALAVFISECKEAASNDR